MTKVASDKRSPVLKNICKRLRLEVFYKKAVLKIFAIFTRWKYLVISVLWKRCSWWLIELWKWRIFILINIPRKKSVSDKLSCSFLKNNLRHIFLNPDFFWLRIIPRELRKLNCHCWDMSSVLSFSKATTLNCSSFVYYRWKSLFLQKILKSTEG